MSLDSLQNDPEFRRLSPELQKLALAKYQRASAKPPVPALLRGVEQYGAVPLATGVGGALGAAALPPAPFVGAMGGAAAGQAAGQTGIEMLNRALGYQPEPLSRERIGSEAAQGALSVPFGKAIEKVAPFVARPVGRAMKRLSGLTAFREAQQEAATDVTNKAATAVPTLRMRVEDVARRIAGLGEKIEKGAEATIRKRAAERQAQRLGQLAGGPLEESLARRGAAAGTIAGAVKARESGAAGILERLYRRQQRIFSTAYERLYRPHLNTELTPEQLGSLAGNARNVMQDQQNFQTLPGGLRRIVERVSQLDVNPFEQFRDQATQELGNFSKGLAPDAAEQIIQQRMQQLGQQAGVEVKAPRVGDLLQIKGDLREFFRNDKGPARYTATEMTNHVLDTLDEAGLAKDPVLNQQYRAWRQFRWTGQALRKLHTAELPEELGDFFDAPMVGPLLQHAKWQEKAKLRQAWGDLVNLKKLKPDQIARMLPEPVLTQFLGPQWNSSQLLALDADAATKEKIFATIPGLGHEFVQAYNKSLTTQANAGARQIKRQLITTLKGLGEPAQKFAHAVAAMPPDKAAAFFVDVVDKPNFPDVLAQVARKGVDVQDVLPSWFAPARHFAFTGGVAAGEMAMRGAVTSPYIISSLIVEPMILTVNPLRRVLVRSITSGRIGQMQKILAGQLTPARARMLGTLAGRIAASDVLRGISPEPEQPEAGQTLPVIPPGAQPVVQ